MKLFVQRLVFNRDWLRVALIIATALLPWQTRFLWLGDAYNGIPWEWNTLSLYISWLPLMIAGFLWWRKANEAERFCFIRAALWWFFALNAWMNVSFQPNATLQWFVEVGFLVFYAYLAARVLYWREVLLAISASLGINAVFEIAQVMLQMVQGASWLGIASQDPQIRGVSIVFVDGVRFLRAYGIFPHPNVAGLWSAMWLGWLLGATVYEPNRSHWRWLMPFACIGLVMSFSRAALLGMVGMLVIAFVVAWRRGLIRRVWRGFALIACMLVGLMGATWHIWSARTDVSAVTEVRSVNEREKSVRDGINTWRTHPWFGVGPRAFGEYAHENLAVPMIYPHMALLAALVEVGVLGMLALLGMTAWCIRKGWSEVWMSVPLLVSAMVDHALWTTWSGLVLVGMSFIFMYFFVRTNALDR